MSLAADNQQTILTLQTRLQQRGLYRHALDGHGAAETRKALDLALPDLHPATAPPAAAPSVDSSTSARHYALAKQYLGIKEQAGRGTHPQIALMFALAPSWLDQDDSTTAWCGIFRGFIGHRAGTGLPAEHYRAAAWAKWGKPVDLAKPSTWQRGDTVVMTRPGGNHVCLLDRVAGETVWCLGGNQSNAVTIARFDRTRVTAVRR